MQTGYIHKYVNSNTVFMFDIDGVLCESQKPISQEMHNRLSSLARRYPVYFVTGNSYTKSVDLINGHIRDFSGIFCNTADELRSMRGKLIWQDTTTQPLPVTIETSLYGILSELGYKHFGNRVEWRNPRNINFSVIGRNASVEARATHDPSWRHYAIDQIEQLYPDVDVAIGGAISIDISSPGATKARACKYINAKGKNFIYIGDKTDEGGNDYPVKKYCEENPEQMCLTSFGTNHTLNMIDEFLSV